MWSGTGATAEAVGLHPVSTLSAIQPAANPAGSGRFRLQGALFSHPGIIDPPSLLPPCQLLLSNQFSKVLPRRDAGNAERIHEILLGKLSVAEAPQRLFQPWFLRRLKTVSPGISVDGVV